MLPPRGVNGDERCLGNETSSTSALTRAINAIRRHHFGAHPFTHYLAVGLARRGSL